MKFYFVIDGIRSSLDLSITELLRIFYNVFFSDSVWVKFNFFILFINNQSAIELFAQNIIKSGENPDP